MLEKLQQIISDTAGDNIIRNQQSQTDNITITIPSISAKRASSRSTIHDDVGAKTITDSKSSTLIFVEKLFFSDVSDILP